MQKGWGSLSRQGTHPALPELIPWDPPSTTLHCVTQDETAALLSFPPSGKEGACTSTAGKVLQFHWSKHCLPWAEYLSFYSTKVKSSKFLNKNYTICYKKKDFFQGNTSQGGWPDFSLLCCSVSWDETEELRKHESLIKPARKEIKLKASIERPSLTPAQPQNFNTSGTKFYSLFYLCWTLPQSTVVMI